MKSKRKLLISLLAGMFVLLAVVATIAIAFALTQQTIKTTLNISYIATGIDAKVSATVNVAGNGEESMVTANGKATSITFQADDTEDPNGTSLVPASAINLTSKDNFVVFKYTFQNTGDSDFIANFAYTDTETEDKNMAFTYSATGSNYTNNDGTLLVKGNSTESYYIKLTIKNVAKNAELSGNIVWTLDSDIVVATPETAQGILDNNIDNKTIVFDEGTYGNLILRPSTSTAAVYSKTPAYELGQVITGELDNNTSYKYLRHISNVEFIAAQGSQFEGMFGIIGCHVNDSVNYDVPDVFCGYDPVKDINTNVVYQSLMDIDGIAFKNMNFTGKSGRIVFVNSDAFVDDIAIKNVTIDKCSFITTEIDNCIVSKPGSNLDAAISFSNHQVDKLENVTITNNTIDGHYQGVFTCNVKNLNVSNNNISNTTHNAIAIQSWGSTVHDPNMYSTGTIVIENNIISDTGDRAIRFGVISNATIEIKNNKFSNSTDNSSLIKTQKSFNNSTYEFIGNSYEGRAITDVEETTITNETQMEIVV